MENIIEFITNFFMKFSGAGWWGYMKPEDWDYTAKIGFWILAIFSLTTFIWLIVRVFTNEEDRWGRNNNNDTRLFRIKVKPLLFLIYFILNTFIHILVMIIGMTIGGGIGMGVAFSIWSLLILVSIIGQWEDNPARIEGLLNIFLWFDQYGNKLAEYMLYRKKLKETYKHFLNIEY